MSRASRDIIGQGISQGITTAFEGYRQKQEDKNIESVLNDPNATAVQKAIALSRKNPQLAAQYYKTQANQSALQQLNELYNARLGRSPQGVGGPQQASRNAIKPNQLMNPPEVPPPDVGMGQNVPPIANEQLPPEQQVAQEGIPQQQISPEDEVRALRETATDAENMGLRGPAADLRSRADAAQKDILAIKKMNKEEENLLRKENNEFRKNILNRIPATKKAEAQYNRLEQLNEIDDLPTPMLVKTIQSFGFPMGSFISADAQELEKLSNDLTANIQSDYGNRILATEFNTFLRRIPTLMNSKQGRTEIIKNLKIYNEAKKAEEDTYLDLYKEQQRNGIKNPIVRQEDVIEQSSGKLDEIFDKMNHSLTKENQAYLPKQREGTTRMIRNGKFFDIPNDQVEEASKMGGFRKA